ncbi:hypothetical protein NFA_20680 [Nocardia farcinica IFM 10152]|uniref:Uncharacterized protein n=1 Tax=Nocardia farcinica (strain IFM 10152) TaxID=247156 RepID=Q5YY27_NOCFA|nr:hypothetical protein NFA_20680 [Nocardia farcinica IFM 10152]
MQPERVSSGRRFKSCQPDSENPFRPRSEGVFQLLVEADHSTHLTKNLGFPVPRARTSGHRAMRPGERPGDGLLSTVPRKRIDRCSDNPLT